MQQAPKCIRVTNTGPASQNSCNTSTDSSPPFRSIPTAVAQETTSSLTPQSLLLTTVGIN